MQSRVVSVLPSNGLSPDENPRPDVDLDARVVQGRVLADFARSWAEGRFVLDTDSGIPPSAVPVQISTWQEAERLAAGHLQVMGYIDAEVTGGGADNGIDVSSTGALAQVKHRTGKVSAPDVRDLYGTAIARGAIGCFYSLGGFTASATKWAEEVGVALFVYDSFGMVKPASSLATRIADGPISPPLAEPPLPPLGRQ